jgi:hypothetical protein
MAAGHQTHLDRHRIAWSINAGKPISICAPPISIQFRRLYDVQLVWRSASASLSVAACASAALEACLMLYFGPGRWRSHQAAGMLAGFSPPEP